MIIKQDEVDFFGGSYDTNTDDKGRVIILQDMVLRKDGTKGLRHGDPIYVISKEYGFYVTYLSSELRAYYRSLSRDSLDRIRFFRDGKFVLVDTSNTSSRILLDSKVTKLEIVLQPDGDCLEVLLKPEDMKKVDWKDFKFTRPYTKEQEPYTKEQEG